MSWVNLGLFGLFDKMQLASLTCGTRIGANLMEKLKDCNLTRLEDVRGDIQNI